MKQKELGLTERRCSLNIFLPGSCRADLADARPLAAAGRLEWSIPGSDVRMVFTQCIDGMSADWERVAPAGDLFFSRRYFRLLETAPPQGMTFGYLLFHRNHCPLGLAYLQFADFDGAATLLHFGRAGTWQEKLKQKLAAALRFRVMVCGNLLLTGEHGFHFGAETGEKEALQLLGAGLKRLSAFLAETGDPVRGILIKDVAAAHRAPFSALQRSGFHRFSFQPSMVFSIPPSWNSFDDYLESLNSKYRVRVRRAQKKAAGIQRRPLSGQDLHRYRDILLDQYLQIANAADFNMVELAEDYFRRLKDQLPADFCLYGYFRGEELLGFATTLDNGPELEAHFLGFDGDANRSCQLYLNMLYDIIADGIDRKKERIVFARTALEIKSSVGAQPEEYHLYFRHHNRWFNYLTPYLVRLLEPAAAWIPRDPFR